MRQFFQSGERLSFTDEWTPPLHRLHFSSAQRLHLQVKGEQSFAVGCQQQELAKWCNLRKSEHASVGLVLCEQKINRPGCRRRGSLRDQLWLSSANEGRTVESECEEHTAKQEEATNKRAALFFSGSCHQLEATFWTHSNSRVFETPVLICLGGAKKPQKRRSSEAAVLIQWLLTELLF